MNAGVLEYHQCPLVDDVGKDPGIAGQFLVGHAGQHRDGKRHLRKCVEQLPVLDQRDAAVVQVLPLIDARGVDAAVHTDHQVERQPVLGTKLGQRPEDEMGQRRTIPLDRSPPKTARTFSRAVATRPSDTLAGAKSGGNEMAQARALCAAKCSNSWPIASFNEPRLSDTFVSRRLLQPLANGGFVEVKHQVIRPQTRNVNARVKSLQRIVEIVGQEHRLQFALICKT